MVNVNLTPNLWLHTMAMRELAGKPMYCTIPDQAMKKAQGVASAVRALCLCFPDRKPATKEEALGALQDASVAEAIFELQVAVANVLHAHGHSDAGKREIGAHMNELATLYETLSNHSLEDALLRAEMRKLGARAMKMSADLVTLDAAVAVVKLHKRDPLDPLDPTLVRATLSDNRKRLASILAHHMSRSMAGSAAVLERYLSYTRNVQLHAHRVAAPRLYVLAGLIAGADKHRSELLPDCTQLDSALCNFASAASNALEDVIDEQVAGRPLSFTAAMRFHFLGELFRRTLQQWLVHRADFSWRYSTRCKAAMEAYRRRYGIMSGSVCYADTESVMQSANLALDNHRLFSDRIFAIIKSQEDEERHLESMPFLLI